MVIVALVTGVMTFSSLWVIFSAVAFWTVETQELGNSFTDGGRTLSSYPLDVMGAWLRRFATFVLPLASLAYLPACWLLGKPPPFGLPADGRLGRAARRPAARRPAPASPGAQGLRHYRSTGS